MISVIRFRIAFATGLILLGILFLPAVAADGEKPKATICEDFENDPKITFWDNDGLWKVHCIGPTTEKAARGKRSYKIDVTWLDTSFDCWRPLPLSILYYGNPTVRANLLVIRGKAQLGHPYSTAESGRRGMLVAGHQKKMLPGTPSPWLKCDARADGRDKNDGFFAAEVIWARPDTDGRTTVYIDDIEIEGDSSANSNAGVSWWVDRGHKLQRHILTAKAISLEGRFRELVRNAEGFESTLYDNSSEMLRRYTQRLNEHCRQARAKMAPRMAHLKKSPNVSDIRDVSIDLMLLEDAEASRIAFTEYSRQNPRAAFVTWIVKPIANRHQKVVPKRFPVPGVVGTKLKLSACPGEYEPASFAVHAAKGLDNLTVSASDAKCGDKTIPSERIDVRLVKCWWQAGVPIADRTHPTLTPELLLYDADFVKVDDSSRSNTVRNPDAPQDANRLLPVDIPEDSVQQFWITVHVPDDAAAGDYRGTIHLEGTVSGGGEKASMDLSVTITVRPFRLEEPILQYSIFYLADLSDSDKPGIHNMRRRSEKQYIAEMHNLKAHGITHPICYQAPGPLLDRAIEIRKKAGLKVDPFYWLGYRPGAPTAEKDLAKLKEDVRGARERLKKHGIRRLFIYGLDEAVGDRLKSQRKAFEAIREAGASTFVACYSGTYELVGDLLDMALFSGPPFPAESSKWHSTGSKIFNYGNPQSGVEIPEVYRRNYGLGLWKSGCDGAMDWAYTHSVNNVWNDHDHHKYRDIVFVYPTVERPIDTIQWEGNREGIDDVRYLSTLLKRIETAESDPRTTKLAEQAKAWVHSIDPDGDLDKIRNQIAAWIVRLDEAGANTTTIPDKKD